MLGRIGDPKKWERDAASCLQHVWFTDCMSTKNALLRPTMAKIADKRLGIEIAAMRQSLWRYRGQEMGDPIYSDAAPSSSEATDLVRWVDTDIMLCDPMTKIMEPDKLHAALDTCYWDLRQPVESLEKKRAKQRQRRKLHDSDLEEQTA